MGYSQSAVRGRHLTCHQPSSPCAPLRPQQGPTGPKPPWQHLGSAGLAPVLGPPSAGFGEGVSVTGQGGGPLTDQQQWVQLGLTLPRKTLVWTTAIQNSQVGSSVQKQHIFYIYMCFTVEFFCINAQYIDIYCENSCFINMELFCFLHLCQFPINTEIG